MQYLRARYYAPQNGSFTTQDSFAGLLTDVLSQNRYTYVQNNPVNYIDPTGHVAKAVQPAAKTGTVKSTASAVTKTTQSSQAKKTYTTVSPAASTPSSASYQKTTYSSGAAKAAQSAKMGSTAATSTAVTTSVAKNSYATVTKAAGQAKLLPTSATKDIATVMQLIRNICNPNVQKYTRQNDKLMLQLNSLNDKHFRELFSNSLVYALKKAISTYDGTEAYQFIIENQDIIRQSSKDYGVPEEYIKAILYRELRFIDATDLAKDELMHSFIEIQVAYESLMADGNYFAAQQFVLPIISKYDRTSTGPAQIFPDTARKAINFGIESGLITKESLGIPEEISLDPNNYDEFSNSYIWNRLRDDVEFNIRVETLNIYFSAHEMNGSADFDSFTEEETKKVLARYNRHLTVNGTDLPNEGVLTYGRQVYELYQMFKK